MSEGKLESFEDPGYEVEQLPFKQIRPDEDITPGVISYISRYDSCWLDFNIDDHECRFESYFEQQSGHLNLDVHLRDSKKESLIRLTPDQNRELAKYISNFLYSMLSDYPEIISFGAPLAGQSFTKEELDDFAVQLKDELKSGWNTSFGSIKSEEQIDTLSAPELLALYNQVFKRHVEFDKEKAYKIRRRAFKAMVNKYVNPYLEPKGYGLELDVTESGPANLYFTVLRTVFDHEDA